MTITLKVACKQHPGASDPNCDTCTETKEFAQELLAMLDEPDAKKEPFNIEVTVS